MTEQRVHSMNDVPEDATARIGSRGGLYYTRGNRTKRTQTPFKSFSGPGYEVHLFKELTGFRIRYKGPNANKIIDRLRGKDNNGIHDKD